MADVSRGRFVWHDLLTTDPSGAQKFYPRVVGWTVDAESYPQYAMWQTGGRGIGGVMDLPAEVRQGGAPPHWLAYISTPDTDASAADAQARGAKVLVGPTDIPEVGRWAILQDPQGAVFALFTPTAAPQQPPPEGPPGAGDFSWHELAANDNEAAFGFYAALFGWDRFETHDMGPMGTYIIYGAGGVPYGGMYNRPADMPAPPHWLPYVHVPSADEAAGRIKDAGGTVLHGPADVPGGDRIAMALDPQGAAFAVHARGSAA